MTDRQETARAVGATSKAREVRDLLDEAHTACFAANNHPIGMSIPPFGNINKVIEIVAALERNIAHTTGHKAHG